MIKRTDVWLAACFILSLCRQCGRARSTGSVTCGRSQCREQETTLNQNYGCPIEGCKDAR